MPIPFTERGENMTKDRFSLSAWVEESIKGFVKSPENTLRNEPSEPAWDKPLVGFSRGDDPLYDKIKELIGPFYWTPVDIFKQTFPVLHIAPGELTVICWVLPQTKATKAANRKETRYASERWVRSRKFGEEFNVKLRNSLTSLLNEAGYPAVAPQNSPLWATKESERYGLSSTWSERHAAYVSGLGTFGLCDGLITPLGKAVRFGSVVARIPIPATPRPYEDHHAYCLFYSDGSCGKCAMRCPAGAITKKGRDKLKCRNYLDKVTAKYAVDQYGIEAYGCGLCQTRVPCESRIPSAKTKDRPVKESEVLSPGNRA
jgi:epoxyqueuosine reductase